MVEKRGVYLLSPDHASAIRTLGADPAIAAVMGIAGPFARGDVPDWVAAVGRARLEGHAYTFVLMADGEVLGLCGIHDVAVSGSGRLVVAIGAAHRRQGNATFAAERMVEFAFQNLQLERIVAAIPADDPSDRRLLDRLGFTQAPVGTDVSVGSGGEIRELTRPIWQAARGRSALGALHPALRTILEAELTAGNEVAETHRGWPDPDSVFVRLRHPFRVHPATLPEGVDYSESNDPHWWKAEYSSSLPRHVLAS